MPCPRALAFPVLLLACAADAPAAPPGPTGVGDEPSTARDPSGRTLHWVEHLIDGAAQLPALRGADGLIEVDLDRDGRLDVVAVHEDSGHVRAAFGGERWGAWSHVTLADAQADGAEDVAAGDLDGDGDMDLVVAAERGHLLLLQNPGARARDPAAWRRFVPAITTGRGSFIRVGVGDFDGDGRLELCAANKGATLDGAGRELRPSAETLRAILTAQPTAISLFDLPPDPFSDAGWTEWELDRLRIPMHAAPVDLDGDGDLDIVGGGRGQFDGLRVYENLGAPTPGARPTFTTRVLGLRAEDQRALAGSGIPLLNGQTMKFVDLDGDRDLDILTMVTLSVYGWFEQPSERVGPWPFHRIGDLAPDHVIGFATGDFDGDGRLDVFVGGYSKGLRTEDGAYALGDPMGRLALDLGLDGGGLTWRREEVSRRVRGMFDDFVARDVDGDGDLDLVGTRGNSGTYDGLFWLEQRRSSGPARRFTAARASESASVPLPPPAR
jgi:hypothetical protein